MAKKIGLEAELKTALETYSALDIINNILLEGMKVVGDLFGSGQMQLPFVLQSAEAMKAAVRFLEPFMERKEVRLPRAQWSWRRSRATCTTLARTWSTLF